MIIADLIPSILESREIELAVKCCDEIGVNLPARFRGDFNMVEPYLKQCLTYPSAYVKEIGDSLTRSKAPVKKKPKSEPIKAVKVVEQPTIKAVEVEEEPEALVWEFPKHYPPILQQKLISANKLVKEKRKLSNQLVVKYPENQAPLVKSILSLSKEIDEIYQAKRDFDKGGRLPKHWLADVDEKTANEVATLDKRVKTLRTYISKTKAKLNNPMEVRRMDIKKAQQDIEKWEAEKAQIQTRIYQLKLYADTETEAA